MHGERKGNAAYIIVAAVLMFCIMGLRDNRTIGDDSRTSYKTQFFKVGEREWSELSGIDDWLQLDGEDSGRSGHERNIGLPWLMKLVYELSDGDYQWFIIVVAILVLGAESFLIQRYSPSPIQSVLYYFGLLFFAFQFSATKQTLAMCFIMLSFPAIVDRRPIRFLLLVICASFFHFPALIFLPAYWIGNMRLDRGYLVALAVVFLLTYVFRGRIVSLMTDTYETAINANSKARFFANKVLIMLVIIVAALLIRPPEPEDRAYSVLLQLIGVATVIQTFSSYNNTFERLADYYFQFAVIFIPMVFEKVETKRHYLQEQTLRVIRNLAPFVFCAFGIWRFLNNVTNDSHLSPFRFFFEQ